MATAFISTSAELVLLNTSTRPGVIILPSTTTIPGRILTFKDTRGTFGVSSITFSTAAATQTLENNAISATYTDPFGAYSFIAGLDNKWYTIGGSRMYSATISSITTISLNSQNISTGNITTSTLQFRDTATRSTTTLFSLSTNVYFSSVISNFIVGPTKAPKPLFIPTPRGFVPTQIAGSILWLDAADPNFFTGGSIWFDKSGTRNNGIHTGIAGNSMPTRTLWTNGLTAARFARAAATTGNSMMTTSATNPALNYSVFIVSNLRSINPIGDPQGQNSWLFINNVEGARQIKQSATAFPATIQLNFTNVAQVNLVTTVAQNQAFLLGYLIPSAGGANGAGYFNGGTAVTGTTLASSSTRWYFGSANASANGYWNGDIGEILVYNTALSDANRQIVEGYLSWKWGLVASLPSTHPYKNSPP